MKKITFNLPFQTYRTFLPVPRKGDSTIGSSYKKLQNSHFFPSSVVGNLNITSSQNFPGLSCTNIHSLIKFSTVALNIIYYNCLFTYLIWFHLPNCKAETKLCYHIQMQCLAIQQTCNCTFFTEKSSFCFLENLFTHHPRHQPLCEPFLYGYQVE